MDIKYRELLMRAHDELLVELFGSEVLDIPFTALRNLVVKRSAYTKAMHDVQNRHELKQGHPAFAEWVFTLLLYSPIIAEDEKEGDEET